MTKYSTKYMLILLFSSILSCVSQQYNNKLDCVVVDCVYDTSHSNKNIELDSSCLFLEGKFLDTIDIYSNNILIASKMSIKSLMHPSMVQFPIKIKKGIKKQTIKIYFKKQKQCIQIDLMPSYVYYYISCEDGLWIADCSNILRKYK